MGKRCVVANPTLIEPDVNPMESASKRRRLSDSKNTAALTLLSLKGESSGFNRHQNDGAEIHKANISHHLKAVAFNRINSSHSVCSSVTDDEEESHVDSKSGKKGASEGTALLNGLLKMALTRPTLRRVPPAGFLPPVRSLPQGMPLPPPPSLPKGLVLPKLPNKDKVEIQYYK